MMKMMYIYNMLDNMSLIKLYLIKIIKDELFLSIFKCKYNIYNHFYFVCSLQILKFCVYIVKVYYLNLTVTYKVFILLFNIIT